MGFTRKETGDLVYYTADHFSAEGSVAHGFSTRLGGVSRGHLESLNLGRSREDDPNCVRENHRRFAAAIGSNMDNLVLCQQVHSNTVRVVTQKDALSHLYDLINFEADGMITDCPGLAIAIFYADCIPVLLYDPVCRVVAAVHSGWRGSALGIAPRAAEKMQAAFGCSPENILAAIGPGICPECFETHRDVPEAIETALGSGAAPYITTLPAGKFQVDLKGIIAWRLSCAGLLPEHISISDLCTSCNPGLFWSHRRLGEQRGNQAAMIQLL